MVVQLGFKPQTNPYAPRTDAARLPPHAKPLADWLASSEVDAAAKAFSVRDAVATRAQSKFDTLMRRDVQATCVATLIGAILLSPLGDYFVGGLKSVALAVQYTALTFSIWIGIGNSRMRAIEVWRKARADAEQLRTNLFRTVTADRGSQALPWQLEYFVQGLLDDQLNYFDKRVSDHGKFLAQNARWRWVGYGALALIASVTAASLLQWAPSLGYEIPRKLVSVAEALKQFDQPRILLALGVVAAMVQNISVLRAQLSLAQRNVERYALMERRLSRLKAEELAEAEEAAAKGDHAAVAKFVDQVTRELDDEAQAWAHVRATMKPADKKLWPWARKRRPG